ncbi:hypothetical protein WME98_05485 [Sorangium sp. So ce296]|uniref:hypothetical protein n=1 Tax=Sorangium sp. So ce296 TaxID=3133296 RepID=UPI003F645CB6
MDPIDYKLVEHLHPDQALLAPVVRFSAISVIEPPSTGNERLMVSFRPAFSRPIPLRALLPLSVACGSSDGGITVDEDDTTSTGSPTSGSSSAGTTSFVAGAGGGSAGGVISGAGGSSTIPRAPGAPFSWLGLRVLGSTANASHRALKLLVHVPSASSQRKFARVAKQHH